MAGSTPTEGASAARRRRAPRLTAEERLAPYITRRGRFEDRDPLEGRPLPTMLRVAGVALWAALTAYAFWHARREHEGAGE